jgi:SpoVK/Ycf46/Vps4 family AAA+-type ATPase
MKRAVRTAKQAEVEQRLGRFADVLFPQEAEEPILAPAVRAAVFDWLAEIRAADALDAVGLSPRRSMLLYGPPGCGKTTLAHHFAARLGLPLACVRSESLVEATLGGTGNNISALFDAMKATEGGAVVFFDEIDSIGSKRMNDQGASVEMASALNVMLRRIEMFGGIAMAATNRQDVLDPALWRRFNMQLAVDLPGEEERFAILRRYAAPFEPSDDDLDLLTTVTRNASPALLRALMEGVKRGLVMAERLNRPAGDPVAVFAPVVAAVAPPPETVNLPALWLPGGLEELAGLPWPWPRKD